ncbi:MAG: GNAT family N-acetyltransferase [Armatimonadota bacterium]|nr:GNAT family N-acetyltransferase [Armatimonadota bacterium]
MPELLEILRAARPVFEPLASHHDRSAFDCGQASLNTFLQRQARQNAARNLGVTHVVVPAPGAATILGYYTLVVRSIERDILPQAHKFPRDQIGVVLLGRLAVDQRAQGQGLGTAMLLRAIEQTERAARDLGIYALVVDALDEAARQWYLKLNFGFKELLDDPRHLYLPIETIRASGLTAAEENAS